DRTAGVASERTADVPPRQAHAETAPIQEHLAHPHDLQDPPLPDPIPASYYAPADAPAGGFARPAPPALARWALAGGLGAARVRRGTPPPGAGGAAATRPLPRSPPVAAAVPPPASVEPSAETTPSPTPTPVPSPTPTPVPTPSPTAASVAILNGPLDGRPGRS